MVSDCQREKCGAVATSAVKVFVPAKNWPLWAHTPLMIVLGIRLCHHHAEKFDVQEVLGPVGTKLGEPGLRPLFELMARGRQPCDFKRAYHRVIPLDDPEFKMLERQA